MTTVTHHVEFFAERHPALVNIALAATGCTVFAAVYWLIGLVEHAGHAGALP